MQIIQSFISNAKYPISDAYDRYSLRPLSLNNSLCAFVFTFCLFFPKMVLNFDCFLFQRKHRLLP